jgi:hypothetical protein
MSEKLTSTEAAEQSAKDYAASNEAHRKTVQADKVQRALAASVRDYTARIYGYVPDREPGEDYDYTVPGIESGLRTSSRTGQERNWSAADRQERREWAKEAASDHLDKQIAEDETVLIGRGHFDANPGAYYEAAKDLAEQDRKIINVHHQGGPEQINVHVNPHEQ